MHVVYMYGLYVMQQLSHPCEGEVPDRCTFFRLIYTKRVPFQSQLMMKRQNTWANVLVLIVWLNFDCLRLFLFVIDCFYKWQIKQKKIQFQFRVLKLIKTDKINSYCIFTFASPSHHCIMWRHWLLLTHGHPSSETCLHLPYLGCNIYL